MEKETKKPKYRLNTRAVLRNRGRIAARRILSMLPTSITEEHYQESLIKYDRRAGSYVDALDSDHRCFGVFDGDPKDVVYRSIIDAHLSWLADTIVIGRLTDVRSILEVGAGELTTIVPLVERLKSAGVVGHACELSWSRLHVGQAFFSERGYTLESLASGSVLELPYADSSFDCVLVHYCLEELSGYQEAALKELMRVSRRYVIAIEASYELGNKHQRRKLYSRQWNLELMPAIRRNKWKLIEHSLVPFCNDAYHHGAIHLLEKDAKSSSGFANHEVRCPRCKGELVNDDSFLFCGSCSLLYPVVKGIPIVLSGNAIVASRYMG